MLELYGVLVCVIDWKRCTCAKQELYPTLWFHSDLMQLMAETLLGGLCQPANVKKHPISPLWEWPEMDEACELNSPFSVKSSNLFGDFITA